MYRPRCVRVSDWRSNAGRFRARVKAHGLTVPARSRLVWRGQEACLAAPRPRTGLAMRGAWPRRATTSRATRQDAALRHLRGDTCSRQLDGTEVAHGRDDEREGHRQVRPFANGAETTGALPPIEGDET